MSRLRQLINEVHRRSLWQVLLVYAGASWAVFTVVQTLTEGLGLPEWFPAFALVLLLVGLPIVLATAFLQEGISPTRRHDPTLMPGGELEADARPREGAGARRLFTWRNAITGGVLALALWGVVATGWLLFAEKADQVMVEAAADRKSVAVLPFINMSADPENEYFSDGITDDIITHLSKIADLKVISRTSVMQYKRTEKTVRQIGDELDVATILEGGVQRVGDQVRINAQLVDAQTDDHLWAESYDRELTDVFAIQRDVALKIAAALKATLTGAEKERIDQKPTENLQAYEYYSRARHEFYKYTPEGNAVAMEFFSKALALDDDYALALTGISLCQTQMINRGWSDDDEWLVKAESAARRALEIEPDLAEAHFALGFVYEQRLMFEEFEAEMKAVLARNPNHAHAHDSLGDILWRYRGLLDEALAEYEIALRLDPFLLPAFRNKTRVHILKGQVREALRVARNGLQVGPDHDGSHVAMGDALQAQGNHREAIASYDSALEIAPGNVNASRGRASSLIALGDFEEAELETDRVLPLAPKRAEARAADSYVLGRIQLERGDALSAIARFSEASALNPFNFWGPSYEAALGEAYLADGQTEQAMQQFEMMLRESPYRKLLHYEFGKILEQTGDTARAASEYQTFLNSWKDADPDLPVLIAAKNRLAELSSKSS